MSVRKMLGLGRCGCRDGVIRREMNILLMIGVLCIRRFRRRFRAGLKLRSGRF